MWRRRWCCSEYLMTLSSRGSPQAAVVWLRSEVRGQKGLAGQRPSEGDRDSTPRWLAPKRERPRSGVHWRGERVKRNAPVLGLFFLDVAAVSTLGFSRLVRFLQSPPLNSRCSDSPSRRKKIKSSPASFLLGFCASLSLYCYEYLTAYQVFTHVLNLYDLSSIEK